MKQNYVYSQEPTHGIVWDGVTLPSSGWALAAYDEVPYRAEVLPPFIKQEPYQYHDFQSCCCVQEYITSHMEVSPVPEISIGFALLIGLIFIAVAHYIGGKF